MLHGEPDRRLKPIIDAARVVSGRFDDPQWHYNLGYYEGLSIGAALRTKAEFDRTYDEVYGLEFNNGHRDGALRGLDEAFDCIRPRD
jgi:hypothetical protein